ncbi:hypothetical protein CRG93_25925 [Escherichia sp. E2593]|nr:hypothetical protein D9738_13845 [Escherichia sp. E10V5]TGC04803.1 hypothetical protein CRG93_25925 [Escherichia sp. E2593]
MVFEDRQINGGVLKEWGNLSVYGWLPVDSDCDVVEIHGFKDGNAYFCDGGYPCFPEVGGHLCLNACAVFK